MTTADVLRDARALIEDPADFWRGGSGNTKNRDAACAGLAIGYVAARSPHQRQTEPLLAFAQAVGAATDASDLDLCAIYAYNDSHGHVEVLAAFDRAIMLAERSA